LFFKGWRSRFGRDLTNLKVYSFLKSITKFYSQPSSFAPARVTHVLAGNGVDHIVRWGAKQLGDDGELVDVILAREKGFTVQHLGKDATGAPNVHLDVVFLPREHDLRSSVVSRRDVASHLGVLNAGETKVADLQVAVLVHENVAGLQVSVDYASRVHVLEASLELFVSADSSYSSQELSLLP
jgi:hypothetical protein